MAVPLTLNVGVLVLQLPEFPDALLPVKNSPVNVDTAEALAGTAKAKATARPRPRNRDRFPWSTIAPSLSEFSRPRGEPRAEPTSTGVKTAFRSDSGGQRFLKARCIPPARFSCEIAVSRSGIGRELATTLAPTDRQAADRARQVF